MNVGILGASDNPDDTSYKVHVALRSMGHGIYPVAENCPTILGRRVFKRFQEIPVSERPIHTISVHLNPNEFRQVAEDVLEFYPSRIIFNPGTECPSEAEKFRRGGVEVIESCVLAMLADGTFDSDNTKAEQ